MLQVTKQAIVSYHIKHGTVKSIKHQSSGGSYARNTLFYQDQPADIFNKTIEKDTINYLSKAYSFVMNIFLNTAKQN